jgi:reductive dehalogenase
MLVWTVLQPWQGTIRFGTLSSAAASRAYQQISVIEGQLQDFLWGLGYYGIQGGTGSIGASNGWGVMAGIGEMSRAYHVVTSPEFGNNLRGMNRMITSLPLDATHPIDAGIQRFCFDCAKCAEACPSGSLNFDRDPTWEPSWDRPWQEPSGELLDTASDVRKDYPNWPWNLRGIKTWWLDVPTCVMCRNCMGACVFSKLDSAFIHETIKAVASTTGIFNSFFRTMDDAFGYGLKDPDSFWELNLPHYGIDTTIGAKKY